MKKKMIMRLAAIAAAAGIAAAIPASAADSGMVFRMTAPRQYVSAEQLRSGDVLLNGNLRIDQYSGITAMQLHLVSDPEISIQDLDFTRDSSQTDSDDGAKHRFFASHGDTVVTRVNEQGTLQNKIVWYGSGEVPQRGVVADPNSSFLDFRVLVPQGTPVGVYQAKVSKAESSNEVGQKIYDFTVYDGSKKLDIPCEDMRVIVEPDALRGDSDCNGEITPYDAMVALRCSTLDLAGYDLNDPDFEPELEKAMHTPYIHAGMKAADADLDGEIMPSDARAILIYSNMEMLDLEPDWNDICP